MTEPPNQFGDGAAYERVMGRWSHLVGEKLLDWLDAPKGLRWIDVSCGMRNVATDVVRIQVANDVSMTSGNHATCRSGRQATPSSI